MPALLGLVEPDERGDTCSPLRWTTKSLRHLAGELCRQGRTVSAMTVGRLLKANGFSLQGTAKTLEGDQHPDRDAQFRYLNEQVKDHQAAGQPVISVDAKKKEQVGLLPVAGREWRPSGQPIQVEDHSFFAGPRVDTVIPYGIYDMTANTGWVNVGLDHDTAAFAVASIRAWWHARGRLDYPQTARLLITADAGGSTSYRYRLWKAELAAFAAETGLTVTACHFPPGTSKWNKIEHRLFSHITTTWRGRPLTSHEVVLNTIAATTTRTGLRVEAVLDHGSYPTGIAISRDKLRALSMRDADEALLTVLYLRQVCPQKMLCDLLGINPVTIGQAIKATRLLLDEQKITITSTVVRYFTHAEDLRAWIAGAGPATHPPAPARYPLTDPRLTGMSREELHSLLEELIVPYAAAIEERRHRQRGGDRRLGTRAGVFRQKITDSDRILATILYRCTNS